MSDWFREAFDRVYREVYPHRSDEQARAEVDWARSALELDDGACVLDLGCGHGRHARAWANSGIDVIGVDLSRDLLSDAVATEIEGAYFVCADMRSIPFRDAIFDAVSSFFTSFGYFATEAEDLAVLVGIERVLVPGGRFVLDFLNAQRVRRTLVPESSSQRGDYRVEERRSIDEARGRVEKEVLVVDSAGREKRYRESVRLYERDELEDLVARAGLVVEALHGDLAGAPHDDEADRLVIIGRSRT